VTNLGLTFSLKALRLQRAVAQPFAIAIFLFQVMR